MPRALRIAPAARPGRALPAPGCSPRLAPVSAAAPPGVPGVGPAEPLFRLLSGHCDAQTGFSQALPCPKELCRTSVCLPTTDIIFLGFFCNELH